MRLSLRKSSTISLYQQLYTELRNKILSKELLTGNKMPPERSLAKTLEINRSTVVKAYDVLKSDGLIQSFKGKGTYVVYSETSKFDIPLAHNFFGWKQCFEQKNRSKHDDIIRVIMDSDIRKNKCFFAGGLPEDQLIPHKAFQELGERCLNDNSLNVLSHSAVSGVGVLKHQIKGLMEERDIYSSVNEQLITSGSQQALDLIFRSFVEEGDIVLVEEPAFFEALQLLKQVGAKIIHVPVDKDGMQMDILEFMIATYKPKLIYTTPTYHNPTGLMMSLERRQRLITLANQYRVPIIEDDAYGEIAYEKQYIPTLKSLDQSNYVIYISTFSKTVALGIRIGWIIACEEVIQCLEKIKQISDLHVNTYNQYVMASFIESGAYKHHVDKVVESYQNKRDVMVKTLKESFNQISFTIPQGGFYIWVTFKEDISTRSLFEKCIQNDVVFTPGYHFMADGKEQSPQMRLNFTYPSQDEIVKGIQQMAICYEEIKE